MKKIIIIPVYIDAKPLNLPQEVEVINSNFRENNEGQRGKVTLPKVTLLRQVSYSKLELLPNP